MSFGLPTAPLDCMKHAVPREYCLLIEFYRDEPQLLTGEGCSVNSSHRWSVHCWNHIG